MLPWLWREAREEDTPGRRFGAIVATLSLVVATMVYVRHDIRETAANVAATSENIDRLVEEFRRSPRRFVRFSIF